MSEIFDTDLLVNFLAVVDNRGFTAAARKTNSTQATVSAKITRLEQQAGHRLLERNRRGVLSRTREGEVVEQMARDVLRLQRIARRRIEETPVSGTVRIGMSDDFANGRCLTSVLGEFSRQYPLACLEVVISNGQNSLKSLEKGQLDYALFKTEGSFPVGATELWKERLVWVSGANQPIPTAEEIRLITFDSPCCYRTRAIEALKRGGCSWRIVYVSPSLASIRSALSAGFGITLLPTSLVTEDMRPLPEHMLPFGGMISFGFLCRPGIDSSAGIMLGELLLSLQPRGIFEQSMSEVAGFVWTGIGVG
ncbi:LysR family transcriptional regulator [Telmatospirillum sp.]|uniref:LysR family transcriptional regulator n=1 Tax=Telmatospirillum sp. TaxID=2079197 RepID=UPI00284BCA82|nr:LysR family transcriptional regulator [Telmatospirillum sp.]MDR3435718.1 LysR family transcriptional regulator [Telmatospirillum sp.]